jgi:hypothetical protein
MSSAPQLAVYANVIPNSASLLKTCSYQLSFSKKVCQIFKILIIKVRKLKEIKPITTDAICCSLACSTCFFILYLKLND